jgi:hypothetical protein
MNIEQRTLLKQLLAMIYLKGIKDGALGTINDDRTIASADSALKVADEYITEQQKHFNTLLPDG